MSGRVFQGSNSTKLGLQLSKAVDINISLSPVFLPLDSAATEAKVRKCKILILHAVKPTGILSVFVHVKVPF